MPKNTLQTFTANNGVRFSEKSFHGLSSKIINLGFADDVNIIFDIGLVANFDKKGKFLGCSEFPF